MTQEANQPNKDPLEIRWHLCEEESCPAEEAGPHGFLFLVDPDTGAEWPVNSGWAIFSKQMALRLLEIIQEHPTRPSRTVSEETLVKVETYFRSDECPLPDIFDSEDMDRRVAELSFRETIGNLRLSRLLGDVQLIIV
jgi:hypothetical protein